MKIFGKTFLYTVLLMIFIISISDGLLFFLVPKVYEKQKVETAKEHSMEITKLINNKSEVECKKIVKNYAEHNNIIVQLNIENKGEIFGGGYTQAENGKAREYSFQSSSSTEEQDTVTSEVSQSNINHILYPTSKFIREKKEFVVDDGKEGLVETILTLQPVNETKEIILKLIPITILVCIILSIIFSLLYTKKITDPIKKILKATNRMESLDRNVRCEVKSLDEIGQLAKNINDLYESLLLNIDNLQKEIEHVSQVEHSKVDFLRAASHELKTPIAGVKAVIECMIIGIGKYKDHEVYLPVCKERLDELSNMIQNILEVSNLGTDRMKEKLGSVNLKEYILKEIEPFRSIMISKQIHFECNIDDKLIKKLPIEHFSQVISNVLINAVNYTDYGKKINIYYTQYNGLVVENECEPLGSEKLSNVFEPFYRIEYSRDKSKGGNGLGLYIVKKILDHYNFSYEFKAFEKGMRFFIEI